jgi:hypothetical protein
VRHDGRDFAVGTQQQQRELQGVLHYLDLHTAPGQRLFVGPLDLRWTTSADTWIYYAMPKLRPASFYLELNPGDANSRTSRLAADLEHADALVLNAQSRAEVHNTFPYARPGPAAPNVVVRRDFHVHFEAGPYSVWLRDT